MSRKVKTLLLLMAFMVPYIAILVPTVLSYHGGLIPTWIPLTGGFYMLFTLVTVTLFSQHLAKKQNGGAAVQPDPQTAASAKSLAMRLIGLWSLFFLYGAAKVWSGAIPLDRAIPAGILLMSFIGAFSWFAYRGSKNRTTDTASDSNRGR
jgi:hypothetical protein